MIWGVGEIHLEAMSNVFTRAMANILQMHTAKFEHLKTSVFLWDEERTEQTDLIAKNKLNIAVNFKISKITW